MEDNVEKIEQFMKLARDLGMDIQEDNTDQMIVYTGYKAVYDDDEKQGYEPIEEEWVRPEGYRGPDKKASSGCESGGRNFCTCDVCF